MTWSRFDDAAHKNPKARAAGNEAWALWAAAVMYCNRYLTDGWVSLGALATDCLPVQIPMAKAKKLAKRLCEVKMRPDGQGLLEDVGDGFYRVHDFLDWNPSKEDVEGKRRSDRERKRTGAASIPRGIPDGNPNGNPTGIQAPSDADSERSRASAPAPVRALPPAQPSPAIPDQPREIPDVDRSIDPVMNPEETMLNGVLLRQRALEPGNAVDHLTATLKVPRAVIVAELESFCAYRECGGGMGDKRSFWLKHFRQQVVKRHQAGLLKPIGLVEHEANAEAKPPRKVKTIAEMEQEALDARS